jgi:hypothetical protein
MPSPKSGSATVPGAHINADTGEFVTPQNAQTVIVKEGKWRVLATSEQMTQYSAGSYSWTEPLTAMKRKLLPEDYYSPFAHGGTIVFRPAPGASGIEQFGTVRLLFPNWGQFVAPAFAFMVSHPALLGDGQVGPTELPQLTQLLSQNNELLAVLAFRELVASGQMAPNLARNQLTNAQANLAAVYTYIALTSQAGGGHQLAQEIAGITKMTHDATKLRSIALGAFSAGLFRAEDSGIISSSKSALGAVRHRLKELKIAVEKDIYLNSIFEKMGV